MLGGQCRGWAMHEASSPAGGLSPAGDGCGQVSSLAWPLGALTSLISQAVVLRTHYLQFLGR